MTERLQEILNRKPSKWGNLTVKEFERDIKLLQECVEELEQKNDRLKQEADFWRVEDREMMRLSHENKRYREVLRKIIKEGENGEYSHYTAQRALEEKTDE